jgi:hypothetical protein
MKHQLFEEIEKFRNWSVRLSQTPEEERMGKWEGAYDRWNAIDAAFVNFISTSEPGDWSEKMTEALLYIIARDHGSEVFADLVAAHPDKLLYLTWQAVDAKSPASRWQLAVRLTELADPALAESLLLRFIDDPDECVRQRSAQTLAAIRLGHS